MHGTERSSRLSRHAVEEWSFVVLCDSDVTFSASLWNPLLLPCSGVLLLCCPCPCSLLPRALRIYLLPTFE